MNDYYLLLTPILMLLVVGLVGFVGCSFTHGVLGDPEPFPGPASLRLIPGHGFVDASWEAVPNATSYKVRHGLASGDYTVEHVESGLSLHDTDVVTGTRYFFAVTAMKGSAESEPSPERSAVPAISLVQSVTPGTKELSYAGFVGCGFGVTQQIKVHRLGRFWVDNKETMLMKLVDAATAADVPGGACNVVFDNVEPDGFTYGNLAAPVILLANREYYLMCQAIPGEEYYEALNTTVTVTPAVTRVYPVYGDASGYVTGTLDGHVYGPVNFNYSASL